MLDKGALERVRDPQSKGFYSRLFLVPKPDNKWRPVIDLSSLNIIVKIPRFKMDTPALIRQNLIVGHWVFSLDLKDAYFQVPMHQSSKKYLRIEFLGQIYQFKALPFGLSTAPWLFTKIVRVVKDIVQSQGQSLFQYLDDWLGQAPTRSQAALRAQQLVQLCRELGFVINFQKSELEPTQQFDFVGIHYNLAIGICCVTTKNLEKVQKVITLLLTAHSPTAHLWLRVLGTLTSQESLLQFGKLHKRHIQWFLRERWNQAEDSLSKVVKVEPQIVHHLTWWLKAENLVKGVPIHMPPFTMRIFTDASNQGWGAHCNECQLQGLWSSKESKLHINMLEMRAVRLALQQLRPDSQQSVLIATDNLTVVSYINHQGGTHSRSLWKESERLFQENPHIRLWARHIPGKLNVIADQLSRQGQILPTEWTLHLDVVEEIFLKWGTPNLDLFATKHNHRCAIYVSPVPDRQALDVDALSISWEGMWAYAYPPTKILMLVLNKFVETENCSLILIAPMWTKQLWYPRLTQLATEDPIRLPSMKKLLKQPQSNLYHQDPDSLRLHAWKMVKGSS